MALSPYRESCHNELDAESIAEMMRREASLHRRVLIVAGAVGAGVALGLVVLILLLARSRAELDLLAIAVVPPIVVSFFLGEVVHRWFVRLRSPVWLRELAQRQNLTRVDPTQAEDIAKLVEGPPDHPITVGEIAQAVCGAGSIPRRFG